MSRGRRLVASAVVASLALATACGSRSRSNGFTFFTDPDLLARNIVYQKTTLAPGETTTASWEVSNEGSGISPGFRVSVYASVDNVITRADFRIASIDIGGLANGDTRLLTATVTAPSTPGSYFTAAFVDDQQDVSESRETNNVSNILQITVTGSGPADLISSNYLLTPTSIHQGQAINYTFQVINVGAAVAGPFRVGIYESPTSTVTTSSTLVSSQTIASLNAGANTTINGNFVPASKGQFYYAVIVDDLNAVTESNDGNNTSSAVVITVN